MGSLPERVDVAVIGGGVGGYVAAIRSAELGKNVVLIEKEKLGGHCLNYACIPSKTLIHIADLYYSSRNSENFGIKAESISIDPKIMNKWRIDVSKKLENGVASLCKSYNIDIIKAPATFLSSSSIQAGDSKIEFESAIIATGSLPIELKGFEFGDNIIDYKQALLLDYIPSSIAIIGAGYVSAEIGTLYAKLGSKVHIIARSDLLSKFDPDAISIIKKRMSSLGIEIHAGVSPVSYKSGSLTLSDGKNIVCDLVVVAVGLMPYTEDLGLENTSVQKDERGFIKVDNSLRTTDRKIFAVGDVIGEPMLAHKAIRQGVIAAEASSGKNSSYDNIVVPSVIFSDPEIALAGDIAQASGIKIVKFPLTALGRSVALNTTNGFVKIAYEEDTKLVKGIEIVSDDANDMIAEAALAIEMGATVDDIASTIHPHPTYSEAIQEAAEAASGSPINFFYGKIVP